MENVENSGENTISVNDTATSSSNHGSSSSLLRKQWTWEQKIEIIELFKKHNNKAMTAREFKHWYKRDLNSKTYNRWIENELKICQSKKVGSGRKALFPDMEEKLNYKFLEMRDKVLKLKSGGFDKQLR